MTDQDRRSTGPGDRASFEAVLRMRKSCRDYLATPVDDSLIRQVLMDAQTSASNCNTQPWQVHVVGGSSRDKLSAALHAAHTEGRTSPDFSWDETAFLEPLDQRRRDQGAIYYGNLGVQRDDIAGRARASAQNFSFFGAPHVALLFMPSVGDNVRVAADLGMYAQTFLLSLVAHGLAGLPQTVLGLYADTVRAELQIRSQMKMLFGISFGHPDIAAVARREQMGRVPIDESAIFHT